MKEKLLSLCTSVLTVLAVLTGSIAVPLLVRPFYWLHIKPFGLERTGLTVSQIREAYDGVMDYCLGLRDTFSAGVLPFSAEGASHFADVRVLFLLDLWVLLVSLAALVLLWVYRRHKAVELHRFRGRGSAFWGCVGLGAAFLVIGAAAAVDFDRAFTVFHTLFFPGKDNWLFDYRTDAIITAMPQEFFMNCALLILSSVVLWSLALIVYGICRR